jgi:serine/threonine protein kinase
MLEQLVRVGFGDQWFPVDSRRLPNFLEPSIKSAVVQQQGIILTKSLDLENGRHCHFKPGEALPFDVLGRLGSGGSGQVDRIKSKISFREYALKRIRRRAAFGTASSQEVVKGFLNEMRIIKRLEHRHIVRYVGSYTEKSFLGLVMTPVADGDLAAYIEHLCGCLQSSSIQPQATAEMSSDLRMYFGCLSAALAYLHNQKIRHKDIKPQNILISNGNVLFADFGISHDFTDDVGSTTSGLTPAAPRYAAPEVIAYEARNNSSDIWSLGCVFLEMAAALRALDVEWIKNYFGERGSRNFHYHSNFAAIAELVENFKTIGTRKDRPVLIWIQKMLLMEHRARPTATRLLEMITLPDAAEPNLPTSIFCGICCIPDLDSDSESDLVDSPVESTQNIPQAGVVSTGKIQRDHNTQQDDDRLSIQSIKSSTTLLSTLSGLTTVEKSATVELESVFQEDVELIGLYRLALKDETLEPDRLQRNIARLLQLFAKDLRREAGTHLERVVSRFVQSKARYVAQCIVEKFHDTPKTPHRLHVRIEQGGSDIGDVKQKEDPYEIAEAQPEFNEYQFEAHDMDEVAPVDEDYFEDLAVLRTFLARSSAFQIFRARLTKFVLPRDWHQLDIDSAVRGRHNEAPLSRFCRFSVLAGRIFKAVLVAVGCLEPPLQPGLIRLRWQCVSNEQTINCTPTVEVNSTWVDNI